MFEGTSSPNEVFRSPAARGRCADPSRAAAARFSFSGSPKAPPEPGAKDQPSSHYAASGSPHGRVSSPAQGAQPRHAAGHAAEALPQGCGSPCPLPPPTFGGDGAREGGAGGEGVLTRRSLKRGHQHVH